MSEFAVHRTASSIPELKYCLVLDGTRIAGGKPDCGSNHVISWRTDETYGPVDGLKAENAKLRELVREAHSCKTNEGCCEDCYCDEGCCPIERRMQELGMEVDE